MKKLLIAVDGSECSLKAADYAGRQFSGMNDLQITILHVLPYPPAPLWDDGHIPTSEEKEERDSAIGRWLRSQRAKAEPLFSRTIDLLTGNGVSPQQIEKKSISDSSDVADSILEEARDGGYQTLVVGRCGSRSRGKLFIGSVAMKIIQQATGVAVCVVE